MSGTGRRRKRAVTMKKVFDGRLISVFRGDKRFRGGRKAYFEEVRHPGAALVVPFVGKRIIMIRQLRPVVGEYLWELPAGTLEPGETPYACASRETVEETGFKAGRLKKLGVIYTTPGFCNEKIHIYSTECVGQEETRRDEDEVIRERLFSSARVRELFSAGKIVDAKTISALSLAGLI
ncbi:MAG: NUDIX domain-containing protein [Candidatus Omnitrophica bacterium]|nr:NUDIX domain-containing protein [Candidatus Omnitrophota bacterium]